MIPPSSYVPSGKVNFRQLWPRAGLLGLFALALATIYALLTGAGYYAVGYVWLVPLGTKIWLLHNAIRYSHCRNRWLAVALALALGGTVQLGTYHIDQCARWGVEWHRVDRLPGYITFRMETDYWWIPDRRCAVVRALDARANPLVIPHREPRVSWNWHWFAFGCEMLAVAIFPAVGAWKFSRRPYSEGLKAWYRQESVVLTPESANRLREAWEDGTLATWREYDLEKTDPAYPHKRVTLWYCPRTAEQNDVESVSYLSLGNAAPAALTPEESAVMSGVFPGLVDWATVAPERRPAELTQTPPPAAANLARFRAVPPPYAGLCKDPGVKWRGRLIAYGLMVLPVVLAGAYIGLTWPFFRLCQALGAEQLIVVYVAGMGAVVLWVISRFWGERHEDVVLRFLIRHYHRTMLSQAVQRDDALFDVSRNDLIYCEILPRRAWKDLAAHASEAEAGLLLIDDVAQNILYEGDRHRWTIPFGAVRNCEVELALEQTHFYVLTLSFETPEGLKELPLCPLAGIAGADRYARIETLYEIMRQTVWPHAYQIELAGAT